jgi:hypothetical protein
MRQLKTPDDAIAQAVTPVPWPSGPEGGSVMVPSWQEIVPRIAIMRPTARRAAAVRQERSLCVPSPRLRARSVPRHCSGEDGSHVAP